MAAELPPVKCARCGLACTSAEQAAAGVYQWTCGGVQCVSSEIESLITLTSQLRTERNDALELAEAFRLRWRDAQARKAAYALDALADKLAPGQSVIIGRPDAEQLAELERLEVAGAWAVTAVLGETVQLFCDDDRNEAARLAGEFIERHAPKAEPEPSE